MGLAAQVPDVASLGGVRKVLERGVSTESGDFGVKSK
jgi:hypothetical protein